MCFYIQLSHFSTWGVAEIWHLTERIELDRVALLMLRHHCKFPYSILLFLSLRLWAAYLPSRPHQGGWWRWCPSEQLALAGMPPLIYFSFRFCVVSLFPEFLKHLFLFRYLCSTRVEATSTTPAVAPWSATSGSSLLLTASGKTEKECKIKRHRRLSRR